MVYLLMGVAGSGKTTVGRLLAARLRLPFHDADDAHTAENIVKMHQGIALSDADRKPWLDALARAITQWNRDGGAVLACSALKERYRRVLAKDGAAEVVFIHLHGTPALIRTRLQSRDGHYFPTALLESQFEALEPPPDAIYVEVNASPEALCEKILAELSARRLW